MSTPASSAAQLREGQEFGPYRVGPRLGGGGMGEVYRAVDTRLNRTVALKVCTIADSEYARKRFRREAEAAAALRHANICPVYEFDVRDGVAYLAMAFIEGKDLSKWVAEHPHSPHDVARLVRKLALAMQAAHEAGVIHRDLK